MKTENEIVPAEKVVSIGSAEELCNHSELPIELAISIFDNMRARAETSGNPQTFVQISDWLADQWEGDFGESSEYLIAGDVVNHSQKAWRVEKAALVTDDGLSGDTDVSLSKALSMVDHSTGEYPRDKGLTYLPKSQTLLLLGGDGL